MLRTFEYNEHGVCLNPIIETIIDDNYFLIDITLAFFVQDCKSRWTNGLRLNCRKLYDHAPIHGRNWPVMKDGNTIFNTKEEAMLDILVPILKEFKEHIKVLESKIQILSNNNLGEITMKKKTFKSTQQMAELTAPSSEAARIKKFFGDDQPKEDDGDVIVEDDIIEDETFNDEDNDEVEDDDYTEINDDAEDDDVEERVIVLVLSVFF